MRRARESTGPHYANHQQDDVEIVDGVAIDPEQPSHGAGAGRIEELLRHEIALLGVQIANRVLVGAVYDARYHRCDDLDANREDDVPQGYPTERVGPDDERHRRESRHERIVYDRRRQARDDLFQACIEIAQILFWRCAVRPWNVCVRIHMVFYIRQRVNGRLPRLAHAYCARARLVRFH